jgi:hypothetical protein
VFWYFKEGSENRKHACFQIGRYVIFENESGGEGRERISSLFK